MRYLVALLLLLVLGLPSESPAQSKIDDPKEWAEKAVELFLKDDIKALRTYVAAALPADQREQNEKAMEPIYAMRARFGKAEYKDLLVEKKHGLSVNSLLYMLRFNNGEMFVALRMIRTNEGWVFRNLQVDSSLEKIFQTVPYL